MGFFYGTPLVVKGYLLTPPIRLWPEKGSGSPHQWCDAIKAPPESAPWARVVLGELRWDFGDLRKKKWYPDMFPPNHCK